MTKNIESFETDYSSSQRRRTLLDIPNYCIILLIVIAFILYKINLNFKPISYWYKNRGDESKKNMFKYLKKGFIKFVFLEQRQ